MKSGQSVCPPSMEDLVLVVVPDDSNEYGKRNFFWVLENMAKNGQTLGVVCFHYNKHISREKVDKDLDEYVSICSQLKVPVAKLRVVSGDTIVIPSEDEDDAADRLKKLICDSGITKLVMPGAADKSYSEKMRSPESKLAKTLMETAPSTCNIWLTCKGHLICTRKANTSVQDIQPQPVDPSALQIVKKIKNDNLLEQAKWLKDNDQHFLHRVNCYIKERLKWCACRINFPEEKIVSHTKAEGSSRPLRKERLPIKDLEEAKENEKRCQLSLADFNRFKLTIENRITNMAYLIQYLEEGARPGGHEGSSMCRKLEPSITNTAPTSKRLVQLIKIAEEHVKAHQRELRVAYEGKLYQEKFLLKIALLERSMNNKEEHGEAERIKIQEKEFKETLSRLDDCNLSIFRAEKEIAGMRDLIKFLKGIGRTMHILNHTDLDADICDVQLRKEAHQRPTMNREGEPSITSVLKMVERMKNNYQRRLHEVTSEKSDLEAKLNNLIKEHANSPKRITEQERKKKSYKYALHNAKKEKSRLEKRIVEAEYLEEIARSGYFLQEPEAAVTEAGGLSEEKNDQQSALTLPAETAVNTEFSKDDTEESKNSLEGEGGSGSVIYKGLLHNTTSVAIKDPKSVQGESDAADRLSDAASQEQAEAQAPHHFRCPISCVLRVDPAADGHTYDPFVSINAGWVTFGNDMSPVTREMIQDKKLIRDLKWMIERWMVEHQGQVRTLTVCDPNTVQSSQQGHPTIPPAAQSQPPTDLHPDPVTSRPLTPPDTTSASSSTHSSTLSRVIRLLREDDDAGSPTLSLPPSTRIRQRWA